MRAGEGVGSKVTCGPSRREAASPWPLAFPPDSGSRAAEKWPHSRVCPENRLTGQQEPSHGRGARANSVQRGRGRLAASTPSPAGGAVGAPVLPPRGVRGTCPSAGRGSIFQESWCREASWGRPQGSPPPSMKSGCLHVQLQSGRGPSPASRAEALGPGEAAHLAVAGARLVHEGAVLTGPHGGHGGMRGAPDGSILLEARKLHPNSACRGEKQLVILTGRTSHRRSSTSLPIGVHVDAEQLLRSLES